MLEDLNDTNKDPEASQSSGEEPIHQESSKKKNPKLSRNVLNLIRTTMRNNIELTHIADNKANVLLSLNALMLTFLVPIVVANFEFIRISRLGPALAFFVITCLVTIYLAALALKPGDFKKLEKQRGTENFSSPFFFGNYHRMSADQFATEINAALDDNEAIRKHIVQDLYYIGARLGQKMTIVRNAYNFFMFGIILSVTVASFIMLFLN